MSSVVHVSTTITNSSMLLRCCICIITRNISLQLCLQTYNQSVMCAFKRYIREYLNKRPTSLLLLFSVLHCCCFQFVLHCCCFQFCMVVVFSSALLLFSVLHCCCFQFCTAVVFSSARLLFSVLY